MPQPITPSRLNHRAFLSALYLNPLHAVASSTEPFCPLYALTHYTQSPQPQSLSVRFMPQSTTPSCLNQRFFLSAFCPNPPHPVASTIELFCPLYASTHYTQTPQPYSFSVRSMPQPTTPSRLNHRSFLSALCFNPLHPVASTTELFCPLYASTHYTQSPQPNSFSVFSMPQPTTPSRLNHRAFLSALCPNH